MTGLSPSTTYHYQLCGAITYSQPTNTQCVGPGGTSKTTNSFTTTAATSASLDGLVVSGNHFVGKDGTAVHLHGVNRSGTEYACIQGWGIFDGPSDAASVAAMAAWHINMVRIGLNEDCWLGINGVSAAYSGQNYINAIVNYVNLLHQHGMYAELSLMWGAPGTYQATYQPGGPDEDHSPAMWTSMAQTFKNDPNVILAPWGETITGWTCFMQTGCNNQATYGPDNAGYETAPMSQAVSDMRGAGYKGPLAIPCIDYANQCANYNGSSWLQSHPADSLNPAQLAAEVHVYGKNACDTDSCFNTNYLPILNAGYPMIAGETGETYDGSDCPSTSYINDFLHYDDAHGIGYEVWTWDTWGGCSTLSLISNYDGTAEAPVGTLVQSYLQTTWPANP